MSARIEMLCQQVVDEKMSEYEALQVMVHQCGMDWTAAQMRLRRAVPSSLRLAWRNDWVAFCAARGVNPYTGERVA